MVAVAVALAIGGTVARADAYPRSELLIEPTTLAQSPPGGKRIVLDARPRRDYEKGRIPSAVWVDHDTWAKSFAAGKDARGWSQRIGGLGIGSNSEVVIYDATGFKDAARIWWILRYWGVEQARLLNGGWTGWNAAKLPIDAAAPTPPTATTFVAEPRPALLASRRTVLESLDKRTLQLIDARSEGEFCGLEKLANKRGGAIPGAHHLEWSDLVDPMTKRFKAADEIAQIFKDAGVSLHAKTVTHCQSGGRASVIVFGMELMGADEVRNYYAGWSDWGNAADTPIETRKPAAPKK